MLSMLFLLLLAVSFSIFCVVRSDPTLSEYNADITLLIQDDLKGAANPLNKSGVLLLSAIPQKDARSACNAVGEQLWSPNMPTSSIQSNLDYLTYQGEYEANQDYLIAPDSDGPRAITGKGKFKKVSGDPELPVLCTQTAPFSNATYKNSSEKWQISVKTGGSLVTGFRDRVSFKFLGVRFAAQPKRFTYSTPYKATKRQQSALEYGQSCVYPGKEGGSEDCLFLNIWTPYLPLSSKKINKKLKPVLFHIHGGGGSGSDTGIDGTSLASRGDVVAVTFNYRGGNFGNLALDDGITNGNWGFSDQVAALDWVRTYIRDFGGNPNRITITGQSYGAICATSMLGSPKAAGKFAGIIAQSYTSGPLFGLSYANYYDVETVVKNFTSVVLVEANCTGGGVKKVQLECLLALPASKLASLTAQVNVFTKDRTYLTTDRLMLDGSAPIAKVNVLMGTMRDDSASFTPYPATDDLKTNLINGGLAAQADAAISSGKFPLPSGPDPLLNVFNVTARVSTDVTFSCLDAATMYAGVQNRHFNLPNVYFYEFNRSYQPPGWTTPNSVCNAPSTPEKPLGDLTKEYFKCHSAEIFYTFGTITRNGLTYRDENDAKFEQFTVDTWTSFMRTGNPNPDEKFLKARGFESTRQEIERAGVWKPVQGGAKELEMRRLQWPSYQTTYGEVEQCETLGLSVDSYV
ncbi:cholinesterase [Cadophora sp. MPI-SDFR-AT-0126]|nr:cholinesterase [Leotiomycetes sp. MPI-SDFR-AT-0126]